MEQRASTPLDCGPQPFDMRSQIMTGTDLKQVTRRNRNKGSVKGRKSNKVDESQYRQMVDFDVAPLYTERYNNIPVDIELNETELISRLLDCKGITKRAKQKEVEADIRAVLARAELPKLSAKDLEELRQYAKDRQWSDRHKL
jgi:hypothetical protein